MQVRVLSIPSPNHSVDTKCISFSHINHICILVFLSMFSSINCHNTSLSAFTDICLSGESINFLDNDFTNSLPPLHH